VTVFEQAFKNIDDVLWKEAGCSSELDYTEQSSWLLFLKYLDDLEQDKSTEAALDGKKYTYILDAPYRWESWAAPKDKDGKLDHNKALTGDDLRDFVDRKLFPYLHGFKQKASGPNTIEYKIGETPPFVNVGVIRKPLTADYVLEYRNTKLAVVEAKAWGEALTEGVAQAKNYAGKMAIRYSYSTNGQGVYSIDMETGKEGETPTSTRSSRLKNAKRTA
jgi:hypothetical protein